MIKVGTVFSGIGAFEEALNYNGVKYKTLFACDNGEVDINIDTDYHLNKIRLMKKIKDQISYVDNIYESSTRKTNFVKQTYLKNHKIENNYFYNDITLLDGTKWRNKIDIFVGGSPCQSFSSIGHQAGLGDVRGTLFYEFVRLVKEIKPQVFIYENVKGLVNHDKGNTWKVIKEVFNSLGYHFKYKVINSRDHGVPQTRNRIFVIGFRNKKYLSKFSFPIEEKLKFTLQDFLIENLKLGHFIKGKKGIRKFNKIKNNICEVNEKNYLSPKIKKYVLSPGTKNFKTKVEIDLKIARTILKTMGNKHRSGVDNYVTTDGKIRMLDPREAMRLMGFDDKFILNDSRNQSYKQAGNSIVVDIFQKIINNIMHTGVFSE